MEFLLGFGLELVIGIAIGLVLTVIGLFFGNISLFESIATGIILGVVAHKVLLWHPALAVLVGVAALALLYFLQTTSVGFWVVSGLYSVAWGFIVCFVVYSVADSNMMYTYIGWAAGAVAFMGLHLFARSRTA